MLVLESICQSNAGLSLPLTAAQLGKWYVYAFEFLLEIAKLCATVIEVSMSSAWGKVSYLC